VSDRSFRIQAAAQISGVNEPLIRAWERRYRVLAPKRTAGGYRTYSEADIEVLKRLKELTESGVAIAQAAALLPRIRRELKDQKPLKAPAAPQLQRWQEEVLLGAQRLDQGAVERVLDEAFRSVTPLAFFEELVAPLMREVGHRWQQGIVSVAEEHLISAVAREKLVTLLSRAPRRSRRHVLAACAAEEAHEFGVLGAALRFRHAGWKVTLLGARTPVEQLVRTLGALAPDVLAISLVQTTGAREYVQALASALPSNTSVVLGGQAARELAAPAKKHGFRVVQTEADWRRLLAR
jgi:DNA-binding transcriptional MerR regulator